MDYSSSSANASAHRSSTANEALSFRPGAVRVVATLPTGADIFAEHLARVAEDRSRSDTNRADSASSRQDSAPAPRDDENNRRTDQASRKDDTDSAKKAAKSDKPATDPQEAANAADDSQSADAGSDPSDKADADSDGDKTAQSDNTDKADAKSDDNKKKDDGKKDDTTAAQATAVETQVKADKTTKTKKDGADKVATVDDSRKTAPLTPEEKKAALQAAGQKADAEKGAQQDGKTADGKAAAAPDAKTDPKHADKATGQALADAQAKADAKTAQGDGKDDLAISSKDKKGLGHEAAQRLAEAKTDATKNQPTANAAAPGQAGYEHAKTQAGAKAAAAAPQPAQRAKADGGNSGGNDLLTGVQASGARGTGSSPTVRIGTLPGQTQPTQLPASALAIQMARNLQKGVDRFEIRLDPPEMGRIDVKMEVHKDGHVSAHMMADKQDTLDLLQRDQRALQQALQNAGLDADNSSLSFSLRDQNPNDGGAFAGNGNGGGTGGIEAAGETEDLSPAPVYNINIAANGGVDIRI